MGQISWFSVLFRGPRVCWIYTAVYVVSEYVLYTCVSRLPGSPDKRRQMFNRPKQSKITPHSNSANVHKCMESNKASTCTCAAPVLQLCLYSNCCIYDCIQVQCEYVLRKKPTKKDLLRLRRGKTVHVHYMSIAHASTTYRKDLLRCALWRSIL